MAEVIKLIKWVGAPGRGRSATTHLNDYLSLVKRTVGSWNNEEINDEKAIQYTLVNLVFCLLRLALLEPSNKEALKPSLFLAISTVLRLNQLESMWGKFPKFLSRYHGQYHEVEKILNHNRPAPRVKVDIVFSTLSNLLEGRLIGVGDFETDLAYIETHPELQPFFPSGQLIGLNMPVFPALPATALNPPRLLNQDNYLDPPERNLTGVLPNPLEDNAAAAAAAVAAIRAGAPNPRQNYNDPPDPTYEIPSYLNGEISQPQQLAQDAGTNSDIQVPFHNSLGLTLDEVTALLDGNSGNGRDQENLIDRIFGEYPVTEESFGAFNLPRPPVQDPPNGETQQE